MKNNKVVLNESTGEFDQNLERGIRRNDPLFRIKWPLDDPILSEKYRNWRICESRIK